jgi:histone deacetylase 6
MAFGLDSVYLHPMTPYCAALSTGGTIDACRSVVSGSCKNAVAVVRPPGHHAEAHQPGGFCFFNNACVATRVCQRDFPDHCRKVFILDWDVHHGNGIQNIFYDDPNVLYISLHVHRDGKFYPGGPAGDHKHIGAGKGEGKNINIPWPQHGMGDGDYLLAFQQIVMPIAQEFDPDLVIIASGFDAAEGDSLGQCFVSPAGYAHMTHMLMSLAAGKVVAVLEGGYNLESIAKSALAVTKTLMGEPPERIKDLEPSLAGIATVKMVASEFAKYWKCLYPKENAQQRIESMSGIRLDDILRANQFYEWEQKFAVHPLQLWGIGDTSPAFKNYVLATGNFRDDIPLVVIVHDAPETAVLPDRDTIGVSAHNMVVVS